MLYSIELRLENIQACKRDKCLSLACCLPYKLLISQRKQVLRIFFILNSGGEVSNV